jgi:DNA-binding transcriptional MerR regulator
MDEISKKELLAETGISYGQLYRWKREGLIPEEWFVKKSSFTGQETFFPKERTVARVKAILAMKDEASLEEIRSNLSDIPLTVPAKEAFGKAGKMEDDFVEKLTELNTEKHLGVEVFAATLAAYEAGCREKLEREALLDFTSDALLCAQKAGFIPAQILFFHQDETLHFLLLETTAKLVADSNIKNLDSVKLIDVLERARAQAPDLFSEIKGE